MSATTFTIKCLVRLAIVTMLICYCSTRAASVSGAGSSSHVPPGRIVNFPACKEAVERLCSNQNLPNDLAVLDCLQNSNHDDEAGINKDCHQVFRYPFILPFIYSR